MKLFELQDQTFGVPRLSWNSSPDIGWWRDGKVLRGYHGSNMKYLESFAKDGLNRKDSSTGMISLAYEPFTARAFAAMGGEAEFRKAGAKAKTIPENERITLVFDIPQSFVQKYEDPNLRGNDPTHLARLRNKEEYEAWTGTDQQYYQLCELRVSSEVPAKYLVGYMIK